MDVEDQKEDTQQKREDLSNGSEAQDLGLLVKTKRAFSIESMMYSSRNDKKYFSNFCLANEKLVFLNKKRPNSLVLIKIHCSFCIVYNENKQ